MNEEKKNLPPCLGFGDNRNDTPPGHLCKACNLSENKDKTLCEENCTPGSEKCLSHECRK